jgi:hypothetical protein
MGRTSFADKSIDISIDLLENNDSSDSEAEVDKGDDAVPEASTFEDQTSALPRSPDGWHDIDEFDFLDASQPYRAQRGNLTSHSTHPSSAPSSLSSKPLRNYNSIEGLDTPHSGSEAAIEAVQPILPINPVT